MGLVNCLHNPFLKMEVANDSLEKTGNEPRSQSTFPLIMWGDAGHPRGPLRKQILEVYNDLR